MNINFDNAKPILFSGPMVRAILAGKKTQTRRIVRYPRSWLTPYANGDADVAFRLFHAECVGSSFWNCGNPKTGERHWQCGDERLPQNYQVGDRLWVKETFAVLDALGKPTKERTGTPVWREGYWGGTKPKWKPSIFMPRWASRLTLEVVSVRVERLQSVSDDDVEAEGVRTTKGSGMIEGERVFHFAAGNGYSRVGWHAYKELWESINGPGSWSLNPWVWVVEFKQISSDSKGAA